MRKYVAWVLEENGFWTDLGAAHAIVTDVKKCIVRLDLPVWFKVTEI